MYLPSGWELMMHVWYMIVIEFLLPLTRNTSPRYLTKMIWSRFIKGLCLEWGTRYLQSTQSHNLHKQLLNINYYILYIFLHLFLLWWSLPSAGAHAFFWRRLQQGRANLLAFQTWLQQSILHKRALVLYPLRDTFQTLVPPWQQGKVLIKSFGIGCAPCALWKTACSLEFFCMGVRWVCPMEFGVAVFSQDSLVMFGICPCFFSTSWLACFDGDGFSIL